MSWVVRLGARRSQHRRGAVLLLLLLCAHWSWCFNPGLRQIQRHRAAPKPRQYQRDAVDFFFNNAEKAAEGQGLRFQMACGTGKTFTYALIISRDLVKNPNGRHVIFVPWRDLARQTAAELQRFHIKTCIVGDGLTEPDPDANVVVCVYASAHRLRGNNYRIKIVDEAHHLEMKQRSGYTGIIKHGVSSELAAHFTATFYVSKGIDFRYDLDRAIEEGHVCDFIITVPVGASTDMEAMGRFILQNRGRLTPMLVALNRVSRAKKFAEVLRKLGLSAKAVDAKMNHSTRHGIKEDLRTGELDAVCVVNIFNEGTSIDELKSVVFMDKRQSAVNVKQLAMRVTRRHETKPLANVVLPLCEDVSYDRDIRHIIRTLAEIQPKLNGRLQEMSNEWFNFVDLREKSSSLCCLEWSNVTMELYDRFGRYLGGGNGGLSMEVFDERVQELKDFVEEHAFLPRLWYPKEPRQALSDSHIWKLKEIPQMSQLMEHWESDAPDLAGSFTERCVHLKKWVAQHHRLPSRRDQSQEEKHLTEMVRQVGKKFRAGQLAEDQVEMLAEIPGMPLKMERWKRLSMKAAMTWSDGCMALADWLRSHGNRGLSYKGKPRQKAGERDEKVLHSWLSSARQSFVNGKLSEEQIGQLEELPTMMEEILWYEARWGPEQRWQRHAEELRSWLQTKGFPAEETEASLDERRLAIWLRIALKKHKTGSLSALQQETLASMPELGSLMALPKRKKSPSPMSVQWQQRFAELQEWYAAHGTLPKASDGAQARSLSNWLAKAKQHHKRGKLSQNRTASLRTIPGVFERLNPTKATPTFEDGLTRVQLWLRHNGSLPVVYGPSKKEPYMKYLSNWLMRAMKRLLDGKLSQEQSIALQKLDGAADRLEELAKGRRSSWDQHLLRLQQWLTDHDADLLASWKEFAEEEPKLSAWVKNQRKRFLQRPCQLSDEQVEMLKALPGFRTSWEKWNHLKEFYLFQQRCHLVQQWANEHDGHLPSEARLGELVSAEEDLDPDGLFVGAEEWHVNLVNWVNETIKMIDSRNWTQAQIQTLRKHQCFSQLLPKTRIRADSSALWWKRFRQLKRWISHAQRIPNPHRKRAQRSQMERKLGWWLNSARQSYFEGDLEEDRLSQLWSLPPVATYFTTHLLPSGAILSWEDRLSSVRAWIMTHGRLPWRTADDAGERQLAQWLQNSCAKARRDELHPHRLAKLKELPLVQPRLAHEYPRLQKVWHRHCESLAEWLTEHNGQLPRGASRNAKERLLALWLYNNLFKVQEGYLVQQKLEQLAATLGDSKLDWSGEGLDDKSLLQQWFELHQQSFAEESKTVRAPALWNVKYARLKAWCEAHGRPPKRNGATEEERHLETWLKYNCRAAKAGKLNAGRLAKLERIQTVSERLISRSEKFHRNLQLLHKWCDEHEGELPTIDGPLEGRQLAGWLRNRLVSARRGKMPNGWLAKLRAIPRLAERWSTT